MENEGMMYAAKTENYPPKMDSKPKVSNAMLESLSYITERVDGINKKLTVFSERTEDICMYIYGSSPISGKEMMPPSKQEDRIPDWFIERAGLLTSEINGKLNNLEGILRGIEEQYKRLREFI